MSPTAAPRGAFWGTLLGLAVALGLNFGTKVSFLWFGPVSGMVAVLAALALGAGDRRQLKPVAPELVRFPRGTRPSDPR